jgi:hypothetical protein
MITDQDRFRQDKSPYERPNFRYRCGRISLWGKPCGQGPTGTGGCGGTSECTPHLDDGRWSCRRTPQSGGACENGPLPDGQCCNQHPACKPTLTLRGYRARLSMLAAALIVALIGAFAFNGDGASAISSLSPGALSSGHAQFTSEKGCVSCHAPHGGDVAAWVSAAWSPNMLTQSCLSCHTFAGPATAPHNEIFKNSDNQQQTQCVMCHAEHKGADANITQMADQQCNACHEAKFASFSNGHPSFSKNYPSRRRTAIAFNHVTHFDKYFQYKQFAERTPKARCVSCHDASNATRNVPVRSFEENCAGCHEKQIAKRDLVIFTIPEFEEDPFDAVTVGEVCGLTAEMLEAAGEDADELQEILQSWSAGSPVPSEAAQRIAALRFNLGRGEGAAEKVEDGEEYLSVSEETLPSIAVMLLGLEDGEDIDAYGEPVHDLVMAMIEDGAEPLAASFEGRPDAAMLFAGLSPDILRRAGCAWAANQENDPSASEAGGWYADELSLRYRPLRHGDPVVKAWVQVAAASGGEALREEMLSRTKGPGACIKCHSVNADKGQPEQLQIAWNFGAQSSQRHVRYSHAPHLNLLGLGNSCETCHKIDEGADYDAAFKHFNPMDFASNFKSIEQKTCTNCHAEQQVRQTCTLCHQYHNGPSFKRRMTMAAKGPKTQ